MSLINAKLDTQGEILSVLIRERNLGLDSQHPFDLPIKVSSDLEELEALVETNQEERRRLVSKLNFKSAS